MSSNNNIPIAYLDLPAQIRSIRPELDAALARVLDNCTFCLGPEVAEFEKNFALHCHAAHCIGFNNGTSALHVALKLLGIGPGDEVITTPFTFVATSWAICYLGARPVFVDIDAASLNLDPGLVDRAITSHTRAILPVHLYGQPADLDPLLNISKKHNIPLTEDAAQAHGAMYHGQPVGTFGRMSCFSFYPGKNLGACGEGGAIVTNDASLERHARSLRDHGSTRRYHHDEIGYNYRMEGIQGAVLNVKLKYLESWTRARRKVAMLYHEMLADTPLRLPREVGDVKSAWHLYVVRHQDRDLLKARLDERRIGCGLHYPLPLHMQKAFQHLGYKEGDFPVAEAAARECLSLPIYPELTEEQIGIVARTIREFFA
jgi:dTDP-4-amino-4,6-dideoxygalactose transaminase